MKRESKRRIAGITNLKLFLFVIFVFVSALAISACAGNSLSQSSVGMFSRQKAAVIAQELTAKLAETIFLAEIEGEEDALPAIVTATRLNVRSGPGVSYPRVGLVIRNAELKVIGKTLNCQWLQVITPSRTVGWVAAAFVSYEWTCGEVAVVTPLPNTTAIRLPTRTTMVTAQATLVSVDTPTETPTLLPGDTPTETPTLVPGDTPTETPTLLPGDTPTETPAATATASSTLVPGDTPTETPTDQLEPTETPTDELEPTETEVSEATPGPEPTDEPTATDESEATPEPVATPEDATPEPGATEEATPEPEATEEATPEPEATDEATPEPEATDEATPEPEAMEEPEEPEE